LTSWKKTEENKEGNRGFYKLTNERTHGLQRSLCVPTGSTLNAFNELNWIGLKGKRKDKGYNPREIETSLNPTQA